MNTGLWRKYLVRGAKILAALILFLCGATALVLAVLVLTLPPSVKSLIDTKEGVAFLAASWGERGLIPDLVFPPRGEAARVRLLVKVVDELQTSAGQDFVTAGFNLAQRPELADERARASARLKKDVRDWLRRDAKARAAAAEFLTYGRSLDDIVSASIDDALRDLTDARDAYPSLFAGTGGAREKPLEPLGALLDKFFERHPLPDLSFVKNPPGHASERALELLNDPAITKGITALNFQTTVAPPGGLAVKLEDRHLRGVVSAGGLEFLRELESGQRCYVERYRRANGFPVVFSYEKDDSLIATPACLSTDLVAGTKVGPLDFHEITTLHVPLWGQLRPNIADKETHKAVIASTVKKLSAAVWALPPRTGREYIRMLERIFPNAMREIAPRLPGPEDSLWASSRSDLVHLEIGR